LTQAALDTETRPPPSLPRRSTLTTWLLPVLATWAMCSFRIGARQLWHDESSTWWVTQLSHADFVQLLRRVDMVMAPYYVLMRAWTQCFGDSEAALRAPSALAMGGCAGLVAAIGSRLGGGEVGLRAGLVFACVPLVSRYGQEARPYAFAALFAALSTLLLLRWKERPHARGQLLAYGASIVALGLSHLVALSLLAAHAASFLTIEPRARRLQLDWRPFRTFVCGALGGCLLVLPLVVIGATQAAQVREIALPQANTENLARALGSTHPLGQLALVALVAWAWCTPRATWLVRLWALLPVVLLTATHPVFHMFRLRYLVFTLGAWALLIALRLDLQQASVRVRSAITSGVVVALVTLQWSSHAKLRRENARVASDFRGAASVIIDEAQATDAIAFGGKAGGLRRARLALAYELRGGPFVRDVFSQASMREEASFSARECADPSACLGNDVTRVWLVTTAPASRLFEGMPATRASLLTREFEVVQVHTSWRTTTALLIRKQPPRAS
jgi:mannosyltransferase